MTGTRIITASRAATLLFAAAIALSVVACGGRQATMTAGGAVFDISPGILATGTAADTFRPGVFAAARADALVDLGVLRSGEVVRYDARIRNTGAEPLVIKKISASCGCTQVEYDKKPVAPGAEGAFSLRFDSRGMQGMQRKTIEIETSASQRPFRVTLRAEVETDDERFSH